MNSKRISKTLISLLFVAFFAMTSVFAQDAVNKAMDLLNRNLILEDFPKAYSYAQFIMKYYADDGLPDEELDAVQRTVRSYANNMEENEQWESLLNLEEELKKAPANVKVVAQTNFQHAHDYFTKLEQEKERQRIEKQKAEEEEQRLIAELKRQEQEKALKEQQKAEQEAETKKMMALIESQQKAELEKEKLRTEESKRSAEKQLEMEKSRQQSDEAYRQQLKELMNDISKSNTDVMSEISKTNADVMAEINRNSTDAMRSVSENNKAIMIGFIIFIVIFVIVILFLVFISYRQNRNNQEMMKNTILTMQAMRAAQPVIDVLPLNLQLDKPVADQTAAIGASAALMLENKAADQVAAEVPNFSDMGQVKNLLITCKKYGEQIDKATGRKNATGTVAELVYKISMHLGYSEAESVLYYAAALVYDIGFLSLEPIFVQAVSLSKEQYEMMKTHTSIGPNMMFFVEEANRNVFKDAAAKHHENLDGTGYPMGLKGDDIPYIARVIRVVESYVAIISQRQYKEIHDRNFAIEELRNASKQYDQTIIDALDALV